MKVIPGGRVPVMSWASQVEDSCLDQAENLSNLPFALSHIALMPDAHPGYGMPIGGVLFADSAIVPYAVGVDIGCGVALLKTSLVPGDFENDDLQRLLDKIAELVPVGNGAGAQHETVDRGREFAQPHDTLSNAAEDAIYRAGTQMGTLGGGNHFIEVQQAVGGDVYVMLHSGSRSVGKKICDYWHKEALTLNERWHSALPDKELAYLPWGDAAAHGYFADMRAAMSWAEQNRGHMLASVQEALDEVMGASSELVTDCHHNYAAWENHLGKNGIVHRKGAVRAQAGETVLIPGSMGTRSYVGRGLGDKRSFTSCQHGAGRARSRSATLKLESEEQFAASMAGILLGGKAAAARDESPFAYKDISVVMADSADLVEAVLELAPMGVVKG